MYCDNFLFLSHNYTEIKTFPYFFKTARKYQEIKTGGQPVYGVMLFKVIWLYRALA